MEAFSEETCHLAEGEYFFFGIFGFFAILVLLGIATNLHWLPTI
jgi:hypothetical protein